MSKKENNKPKGKLFGRNLFTILFVIFAVIIIFFLIYIPYSYIKTRSKASPVAYETNVTDTMISNVGLTPGSTVTSGSVTSTIAGDKMTSNATVMKGKDFKDLTINFYAEEYDDLESGNAKFYCSLAWNDNTKEMLNGGKFNTLTSSYNVYVYVCLTAPWALADDKPIANYSSLQYFKVDAPNAVNEYSKLADDATYTSGVTYYTKSGETYSKYDTASLYEVLLAKGLYLRSGEDPDYTYTAVESNAKYDSEKEYYSRSGSEGNYTYSKVTVSADFASVKSTLYTAIAVVKGDGPEYSRSAISVSGLKSFPYKTKFFTETFPTVVTVEAPTAYVYVYFKYVDGNNKSVTKRYILEYEYDEYHTSKTKGGINWDKK